MSKDWKDNPRLSGIDPSKLALLQQLADQSSAAGKTPNDMLQVLMNAASQGKQKGLRFHPAEISAVVEALKAGKTPEEAARLDRIVSLMRMMH